MNDHTVIVGAQDATLAELIRLFPNTPGAKLREFQKKKAVNSRDGEPSIRRNSEALVNSNLERTRKASEVQITKLIWALEVLRDEEVPPIWIVIARARIDNPELSYVQIARMIGDGLTKDAVAGTIRRTIERAKRVSP